MKRGKLFKRGFVAVLAGLSVGVFAAQVIASNTPPPPPGLQPDGTLDISQLPDCVPIGAADGTDTIVGCVERDLLYPTNEPATEPGEASPASPLPVVDELGEVVGQYVPGEGFVSEEE